MIEAAGGRPRFLADVVTLKKPLGPAEAEALVEMGEDIFRELYDETAGIHAQARRDNPFFVIGRKGAGKTAFLIGAAIADNADVAFIGAEDIYLEVSRLASRYSNKNGALSADNLVHVWEVLLFHAALLEIARSSRLRNSGERQRIWAYVSAFGDPAELEIDGLLARVSAKLSNHLVHAEDGLSFREACWSIGTDTGNFLDAAAGARTILEDAGPSALYVVVDNLEDLHKKLDEYADVVTALFRVAARGVVMRADQRLPFRTRFAFPAELLPRLEVLAANPDKDFQRPLTIRWTAKELIVIAGNRMRTFLDVHFPSAPKALGLPSRHDPTDSDAAEATLRAVLPHEITNALGTSEESVAYLMRHTQLLPRHLIIILNEILSRTVMHLSSHDVPQPTADDVIAGVLEAERGLVNGILATYSYTYPAMAESLTLMKNQIRLAEPTSQLHRKFNEAGVHKRTGLSFRQFLDGCIAVGVLGIVEGRSDTRYVRGVFSYTFAGGVRPVEDRDAVCVHPLFVSRLFDGHKIRAMAGHRPIYPYGSDPSHVLHEV